MIRLLRLPAPAEPAADRAGVLAVRSPEPRQQVFFLRQDQDKVSGGCGGEGWASRMGNTVTSVTAARAARCTPAGMGCNRADTASALLSMVMVKGAVMG